MAVDANGNIVVVLAAGSTIEGTSIASTGEVGANKYLREDGDGTSSWQTVAGSAGDMEVSTYDPAGIAEQLVGLVASQSLSNKTLVAPALGTPASGVMTNVTGTAASLTVGNATAAVTSTNLAGGTGGTVPYQSAAGTTAQLANGTAGQVLTSAGTTLAPTWSTNGAGDVVKVGTPVNSQVGVWTGDGTIEGGASLTYDGSNLQLTGDIGSTGTKITKGWFTDLVSTNAIAGSITGNAATVTTITGLAPDTATTEATQASITTAANLTTVGTVTTGNVDAVVSAASVTTAGKAELATTAEIDTGTDSTRTMPVDQFVASKRNIRWLVFNVVDRLTDCSVLANVGGDFVSPIAGTILQNDSTPFYLYATNSTAGTTGTMVVDVHLNGTTIMTTNKLDFDTTEKTTTTAATKPDLTDTTIAVGDILTIDIDSLHTTAAKGLTVYLAIRE